MKLSRRSVFAVACLALIAAGRATTLIYPVEAIDDLWALQADDFKTKYAGINITGLGPSDEGWYVRYRHENLTYMFGPLADSEAARKKKWDLETVRDAAIRNRASLATSKVDYVKFTYSGVYGKGGGNTPFKGKKGDGKDGAGSGDDPNGTGAGDGKDGKDGKGGAGSGQDGFGKDGNGDGTGDGTGEGEKLAGLGDGTGDQSGGAGGDQSGGGKGGTKGGKGGSSSGGGSGSDGSGGQGGQQKVASSKSGNQRGGAGGQQGGQGGQQGGQSGQSGQQGGGQQGGGGQSGSQGQGGAPGGGQPGGGSSGGGGNPLQMVVSLLRAILGF